jgi:predicted nucleic acid-binding protein
MLPTGPLDREAGAALYRVCRRRGETVRKLIDCLIGAVAVRHSWPTPTTDEPASATSDP